MKRTFTPRITNYLKSKLEPQQSTIDFILGFAASYETSENNQLSIKMPGYILN